MVHLPRGDAPRDRPADRPLARHGTADLVDLSRGESLPGIPRGVRDSSELPEHLGIPADRPADHPPVEPGGEMGLPRSRQEPVRREFPPHRAARRNPICLRPAREVPDPLDPAAEGGDMILGAGEVTEVGGLDLHRLPRHIPPASPHPRKAAHRQHRSDEKCGRRPDPGANGRLVAEPKLDPPPRRESPQRRSDKAELPLRREPMRVGGFHPAGRGFGHEADGTPNGADRDDARHADRGVDGHRSRDEKIEGNDIESSPRDVDPVGHHRPDRGRFFPAFSFRHAASLFAMRRSGFF